MSDGPTRDDRERDGRGEDGREGEAPAERAGTGWGRDRTDDRGTGGRHTADESAGSGAGVEGDRDAAGRDRDGADREDDEPSLSAVLGASEGEQERRELVPESPSLEHAAFVVLGVLFSVFVLYRAWAVFVG